MVDNHALNKRYADRFEAFIANTTENERQHDVADALLHRLHLSVPGIFRKNGMLDLVDFGCGPGEMARHFQKFFESTNPDGARVNALEMNRDHMATAQRHIKDSVIVPEDIFTRHEDLKQKLALPGEPAAIFVSHSGYYGYDKDKAPSDQPRLEALADNIERLMGKETVAFVQHKAPEPTNALKRKYANIVESDTTNALERIFARKGMKSHAVQFEAVLNFPQVEKGLWKELENPKPYPESAFANGKQVRDLLEFLVHKGLEEMAPDDRKSYLKDAQALVSKHEGRIPTFIEQRVVLSKEASRGFAGKVKEAVEEVARSQGGGFALSA